MRENTFASVPQLVGTSCDLLLFRVAQPSILLAHVVAASISRRCISHTHLFPFYQLCSPRRRFVISFPSLHKGPRRRRPSHHQSLYPPTKALNVVHIFSVEIALPTNHQACRDESPRTKTPPCQALCVTSPRSSLIYFTRSL